MCRSKLERDKDRDISEKIALGVPSGAPSQESLFDQRLFNQTQVSIYILQDHVCVLYREMYSLCRDWILVMVWKMTRIMFMIKHGEQVLGLHKLSTDRQRPKTRISMEMMLRNL